MRLNVKDGCTGGDRSAGGMLLRTDYPLASYLQPSPLIDFGHPDIQRHVAIHGGRGRAEAEVVRGAFEFVRDEIKHSWDIGSRRVTAKASEVLRHREGICYAKSHLLAALLRAQGIPSGLCYQRLTLGDTPDTGYCVHALNTVYLASVGRWIRLDARGNKPGADAQFSPDHERLAFVVREECGEKDYRINAPEPHPKIVDVLTTHDDCLRLYAEHLPADL